MGCKELDTNERLHSLHLELNWASQVALVVKNPHANAGDIGGSGLIPGLGRSPGEEHSNPFQYPCLENPMDTGAWQAMVHGVAKSWTRLEQLSECASTHTHTELNWNFANLCRINYSPTLSDFLTTDSRAQPLETPSEASWHPEQSLTESVFSWNKIAMTVLNSPLCQLTQHQAQRMLKPPSPKQVSLVQRSIYKGLLERGWNSWQDNIYELAVNFNYPCIHLTSLVWNQKL